MKRSVFIFYFLLLTYSVAFTQSKLKVGDNSTMIISSAALEVESDKGGILPPRLSKTQRDAISSPVAGLFIWCSDCAINGEMQVYNGASWLNFIGSVTPSPTIVLPTILTNTPSTIASSTITISGTVVSTGGAALSEVGFCYSTSNTAPTKLNSSFVTVANTTNFATTISGLSAATLYYVRAYGINSGGTSYGATIQITTANSGNENQPTTTLSSLLSQSTFESMFPYRADKNPSFGNGPEFYSYNGFNEAIDELKNIKLEIFKRQNTDLSLIHYTYKYVRTDLRTNQKNTLVVGSDYNESWNTTKPEIVDKTVLFSDFLGSTSTNENKKELAAFFANISHETTGGGNAETTKTYGLYWKGEISCNPADCSGYTSTNIDFPATPGKTYQGRGPIQLSWNYNYGPASFIIFGSKNTLLQNPEKVLESGKNAFMTAILFWMLPQSPKPSCHEVIHQIRGFAKTVVIINGGLECGSTNYTFPAQIAKVQDRIDFYKKYLNDFSITIPDTDTELHCGDLTQY